MYLELDRIHESPGNARSIASSAQADEALRASLDTIGLLQPILVVRNGGAGEYEVRAGHRRLRAAKALGWEMIQAVVLEPSDRGAGSEVPETAMSAAENMVRAPMHPVDQWRAIASLRDSAGYSLQTAAAALGVPHTQARRMEHLGRLAPELLEAIGQGDLPEVRHLRVIAMATHDIQRRALAKGRARNIQNEPIIDWRDVAEGCTVRRIPRSRALFDHGLMAWDEDLFAEGNDEFRFTTSDLADFLQLQEATVTAMIAKSKGRMERLAFDENGPLTPKGWRFVAGDPPRRWRKEDPRRCFVGLYKDGYSIGLVSLRLAEPIAQGKLIERLDPAQSPPAKPERGPINKATLRKLAEMKAEALRARLLTSPASYEHDAVDMLRALLLTLCARNVAVGTMHCGPDNAIAQALITPAGNVNEDADLCALAAKAISDILVFDAPDVFRSSGPAAEWIATHLGGVMPRTDSEEILKGISGDELVAIAVQNRVNPRGTVSALRKRLVGALPYWRAVTFGAPGPMPHAETASAEDSEEEDFEDVYEGPNPLHRSAQAVSEDTAP